PPRARRPEHQPVRTRREVLVGQRLAEQLVVGAEVLEGDTGLRDAGGAAGLEDEYRLTRTAVRDPTLGRAATQPRVLERAEPVDVGERVDCATGIPSELRRVVQPERRSGGRVEMPVHDLTHVRVERRARRGDALLIYANRGRGSIHRG